MAFKLFEKPKKKTSKKPSKPKKGSKKTVKKKVKKPVKKRPVKKKTVIKKKVKPKKMKHKKVKKKKVKRKVTKKKKVKKKVVRKKSVRKKPVKKKVKKIKKAKPKKVKAPKHVKRPKIKLPLIEKMADNKTYDLIRSARLPVLKTIIIKKEKDFELIKKIGFPCMMKVSGTKLIHKTDIGGIIKVNSVEEVDDAYKKLMKIRYSEGVLVQEYKEGTEMIVGAKSDPHFGHVISVGLGGIYVEILKDVKFRICPITDDDAKNMVKELKGYDIIAGARGKKPIHFASLHEFLAKMCRFAAKNKIKEMDINPLICDDKGCYIADVKIIK